MNNLAIYTENLTRNFGIVQAVDHLSLEVPRGVIFGFLGPNGAGKTTTIRLLLGLLEPSQGKAEVMNYDTHTQADEIRLRSGALLEHAGIYERLSAEDNLEYYGRIWRLPAGERSERIKELLTHFDLWERRKETAGKWSKGMKQKLAIARALLHHPALVFLDEPTAGLDPISAAALRDDLATLVAREGVTVFLNTHNLAEAEKLCNLVGVIRQGKLMAVGNPVELRAKTGVPRVEFIGKGFHESVIASLQAHPEIVKVEHTDDRILLELHSSISTAPLVNILVQAGAEVEEVRKGNASLEEVFLTLMEEEK
ncbi:MAG: ABC transporter ATP-binding protein [Anaerolineales bacterium]|nr:ABC transporter ATP-binding protein [Anaerolineales bacterium]